MRITQFKEVYDAIVSRHGLDPEGDRLTQNTARAILRHVNKRVREGLAMWDFPEFSHTEERAYRSIWNSTRQLRRVGEGGQPDEVFFIPPMRYFKVKKTAATDPPVGTPPATSVTNADGSLTWTTDSAYFEDLSPVESYIAYDQACRRSMGEVLGVYRSNPQHNGCDPYSLGVNFRPHEKGVYVCCAPGPTVYVHYMLPPPQFTVMPYIETRSYVQRNRVYFPDTGECYRAIAPVTGQPPTNTTYWTLEPFPAFLQDFVVATAYADCLRETWVEGEDQVRLARAKMIEDAGVAALQGQIDSLLAQGQKHYYMRPYPFYCECVSQPWNGSSVTTLSDECQEEFIFWLPPSTTGGGGGNILSNFLYQPEIVSLRGPDQPALNAFPTVNLALETMMVIVIDPDGSGRQEQDYQLKTGGGDALDGGHVRPLDWNATDNDKYWRRVGG